MSPVMNVKIFLSDIVVVILQINTMEKMIVFTLLKCYTKASQLPPNLA